MLFVVLTMAHLLLGIQIKEEFSWNQVIFEWPDPEVEKKAISSGAYIPENNLILGMAIWMDKLFITIPRWKAGVASALNYVEIGSNKTSPLKPYPSWDANFNPSGQPKNNATIVSPFRVFVDRCDRLWVMDTGVSDFLGKFNCLHTYIAVLNRVFSKTVFF